MSARNAITYVLVGFAMGITVALLNMQHNAAVLARREEALKAVGQPLQAAVAPVVVEEAQGRCGPHDAKIEAFRQFASGFDPTTDKVTTHAYHLMYGQFLAGLTHAPIKFLEIGLGCGMQYAEGGSHRLWRKYLAPGSQIFIAEFNKDCAENYRKQEPDVQLLIGDQSNAADVQRWVDESNERAEGFDVIIDDGGHTPNQQKVSFDGLWPHVKSGGLYFIEDLQVGREYPGRIGATQSCMADVIELWIDALLINQGAHPHFPLPAGVQSIYCQRESCVIMKQ